MTDIKTAALENIIGIVETVSAVILLIGFCKGVFRFIGREWQRMRAPSEVENLAALRPEVGGYILLGLDFYIVSDILSTMLRPDPGELISLAVIGLLRTAIGYFLAKEIA